MGFDEYDNPRASIETEITGSQVYSDDLVGCEIRIVYADAHVVVARYDSDRGLRHRLDSRRAFEENVGSGRYDLVEPSSESPRMPDEFESIRALVLRMADTYRSAGTRVDDHKEEAMLEFLDELEELAAEDPDPIDFESVDGIGGKAAENLRDAGFRTALDVRRADRSRIEEIPLMGESNTTNLLEEVSS